MRQILIFFWVVVLSVQAVVANAASARVESLTFSSQQGGRLAFDLNATPHYRYFTLKNPSRLVVDFENTALSQAFGQPPADHPLAVGVRSAIHNNTGLRVVVELNADADVKVAAVNTAQGVQLQFDLAAIAAAPVAVQAASTKSTPTPDNPPVRADDGKAVMTTTKIKAKPKAEKAKGRSIVVAIDAGHGGKDVGAQGGNGTQEKDVVLAIAKRLESAINRQPGMKAVMIRKGDYFVKLRERVNIARKANADLFVSIHADAFDDASAHGASVYTLANDGATSQMAQYLANSENASDSKVGEHEVHDEMLASVLMDLSNKASKEASQHIGNRVLKSVKSVGHLHRSNVQKAGFVVLKSPIPSILVETAFISNPEEEHRLNTRAYQDKMASAVFSGIVAHFKQYAPADTLFAQLQKSGKQATQLAARETQSDPELVVNTAKLEKSRNTNVVTVSSDPTQHVISRGETLSEIAQQYGVSMRQIRTVNGMGDGEVKIGQVLQIPRSS
ncbi:N-acetylmuramoyl-L-alanine amidase [Methylomonas sp. LL1]|uniref:N-acetylmuramoyl-L-alanine amidase n=1 Tax=Methylomonas sp. LL1 TaxID=2785785 RepID=UPI0018C3EB52|nr:N-acetylmuramoyl-L-alanine amidase [Methylomonas sp. LL1]QPK64760.1 N-acetylmuramoyl-L-alanine amidase [Methylomonas sp. LL1]